jgi:general secretion pathway protein G
LRQKALNEKLYARSFKQDVHKERITKMKMQHQKGFSLLEIMVVLVIMGIMAALVGPQLLGNVDKARLQQMAADMKTLETTLKMYRLDNFTYPSSEQGLQALVTKPDIDPQPKNWKKDGYIDRLPKDPWGNDYLYVSPGEHGDFDIYSLGSDGVVGGEGQAKDRGNWMTAEEVMAEE